MNNHTVLLDNNAMLSDIHRNVLAGQEGTDNQNEPVSITFYYPFDNNADRTLDSSQVSDHE